MYEASDKTRSISPREKKQVQFSMALGNSKFIQECSPEHLGMGTARTKLNEGTEEERKK